MSSFFEDEVTESEMRNARWIGILPSRLRTRLIGRFTVQRTLSNALWLFLDRILRLGLGLGVGVWVARYLGPSQYGLFNWAAAFVGLFTVIAGLGLDSIVVRDLVREAVDTNSILGTTFHLRLIGGGITILLATALARISRPGDALTWSIVAIISIGVLLQAFDTIDLYFQSQIQSRFTVWVKNLAFVVLAGVRVFLILSRAPLHAFAWAVTGEIAVGAAGLLIIYRARGHSVTRWQSSLSRAKSLLKASWPLVLSGLAISIYMRIGQIMLGTMLSNEAVGLYSAAVRIAEVWYFVPVAISSSVLPTIVRTKAVDESVYYNRLQRLLNIMAAIGYSVAIPVALLSKLIVRALYGAEYAGAGELLAILVWAGVFVSIGVVVQIWYVTEGLTLFSLATTVLGAITSIGLNFWLMPRYGIISAPISSLSSQFVSVVVATLVYPRTRRMFLMEIKAFALWGGLRF